MSKQIRIQHIKETFGRAAYGRPLRLMGHIGTWTMVRHADFRGACPFVVSRKEWDAMPIGEASA